MNDTPLTRLALALRAEGYDDVAAGCAILKVYPWADTRAVVSAVLDVEPVPMAAGWYRGMFAGKAAMDAVRAAVASIRRRDDRSTRRN